MPVSGKTDKTAAVYVMGRHLRDRPYLKTPHTNAERPDTDFFYDAGIYDAYPSMREAYEARRKIEERSTRKIRDWGLRAVDAMDRGAPMPDTKREVLMDVLWAIYNAGVTGATRPEICRKYGRDGGKVSAAMTDLHAAGIIFPLEGVRR
jgi:hypothetical protein